VRQQKAASSAIKKVNPSLSVEWWDAPHQMEKTVPNRLAAYIMTNL
jgi:hypothetical protein